MEIDVFYYLILSTVMMFAGIYGFFTRRNLLATLISEIGTPVAVYAFQGARITRLSSRLSHKDKPCLHSMEC